MVSFVKVGAGIRLMSTRYCAFVIYKRKVRPSNGGVTKIHFLSMTMLLVVNGNYNLIVY
jgi:hypothetical protein